MAFVWADSFVQAVETATKTGAAAPNIGTAHVDLFSNLHSPNRADDASMYTVCVFTGYAQNSVTPSGPHPDTVHGPFLRSALQEYTVGSPALVGDTARGYVVRDAGGNLIGAEQFATPVDMSVAGASIALVLELRLRDYGF